MEIWHQKVGKDMERLGRTQGFLEPHHPQRGQRSPQLLACWRICFESGDLKYFKEIGPFNGLNGSFHQLSSLFHCQPRIHRADPNYPLKSTMGATHPPPAETRQVRGQLIFFPAGSSKDRPLEPSPTEAGAVPNRTHALIKHI